MKKTKYSIEFEAYECSMSAVQEISKKAYETHLKALNKELNDSKDYDTPLERYKHIYESEAVIKEVIRYDCGCASTRLIKWTCKEGFIFKSKKEVK